MVGKGSSGLSVDMSTGTKERPVFIPPRKRQQTKTEAKKQNYVDHIVSVQQNRPKLSPSNPTLEEELLKSKLIIKNKQPLPQLPGELGVPNAQDTIASTHSASSTQHSNKSARSTTNINELQNFESISQGTKSTSQRHESSTVTPSSCCYSESSLDAKISKSHDCLSNRSSSKKRVNIRTADLPVTARNQRSSPDIANYEDLESGETSVLNTYDHSLERYQARKAADGGNYLTMTGTIKRGRKKGQSIDLQINISREELEQLNAHAMANESQKGRSLCCTCSCAIGLHIFLISLLCLPFVTIISAVYSFYIGTLTWYNMFNYYCEEKSYLHKIFVTPLLFLAYPLAIVLCTFGLGLYSGFRQLSLQYSSWVNDITDIEKGFYGWLCGFLHMPDCSPYEVVILTDICVAPQDPQRLHINKPRQELSM
ncbi:GL12548 [Drosophila persimilis]|uniref:Transmembrane protein 169 n=2 Tax=pseudoobscura subgroup TaxID=32358 RepID=A0A6I8URV1_DROPS|nr:uncharacterized protein LOC4803115 [Drosophila pseudoobscura]XP_002019720.1 uncharacterized protein LOC6594022 [Drosophila persimilis]XP_017145343.1 uncharacterized protein LOC108157687 [Drosophila miranda]EDW38354.1 GL12548 [Drosophila persimilis]